MGRIVPNYLDEDTDYSERAVANALRNLSDKWIAFHSVGWMQKHGSSLRQGEIDFVLLNRDLGILAIEVKGGSISFKEGEWTSTPAGKSQAVRIKDPLDQASRNKWAIKKILEDKTKISNLPIGHAAAFSGGEPFGVFGARVDSKLLISKSKLQDPKVLESTLEEVLKHQNIASQLSSQEWDKIEEALAPTFAIESSLTSEIRYTFAGLEKKAAETIRLTLEQINVLSKLWAKPRVGVVGTAGTGKTLLALEQARRLNEVGSRVLLISGRGPLLQVLERELLSKGVTISGFDSVGPAVTITSPQKILWDLKQTKSQKSSQGLNYDTIREVLEFQDEDVLQYIANLMALRNRLSIKFDALIIDEAQDIEPKIFLELLNFLESPTESPVWFFFDPAQSNLSSGWQPPIEAEFLPLSTNCRNSVEIQKCFSNIPNLPEASVSGVHGPEPIYKIVKPQALHETTKIVLDDLLKLGFGNDDFIIISCISDSKLITKNTEGKNEFRRGIKKFSPDRFKGMEANVVLLWLDYQNLEDPDWDRKFYIGVSRAVSQIYIFGDSAAISRAKTLAQKQR